MKNAYWCLIAWFLSFFCLQLNADISRIEYLELSLDHDKIAMRSKANPRGSIAAVEGKLRINDGPIRNVFYLNRTEDGSGGLLPKLFIKIEGESPEILVLEASKAITSKDPLPFIPEELVHRLLRAVSPLNLESKLVRLKIIDPFRKAEVEALGLLTEHFMDFAKRTESAYDDMSEISQITDDEIKDQMLGARQQHVEVESAVLLALFQAWFDHADWEFFGYNFSINNHVFNVASFHKKGKIFPVAYDFERAWFSGVATFDYAYEDSFTGNFMRLKKALLTRVVKHSELERIISLFVSKKQELTSIIRNSRAAETEKKFLIQNLDKFSLLLLKNL